jgi:NADPH:quinone reductase-like Zn-dependent oxidoreductase
MFLRPRCGQRDLFLAGLQTNARIAAGSERRSTRGARDGALAQYTAVEARNLAPLPGDVDFTVGASLETPKAQGDDLIVAFM